MPEEIKKESIFGQKSQAEPTDIFSETELKETVTKSAKEPPTTGLPREFTKERRGLPKIFIFIIILAVLVGLGFLLSSFGILKVEKGEQLIVTNESNVPAGAPPTSPPPQTRDTDADGLSDEEEISLGTKIDAVDSDNDGLFDREEVKIYGTDPLNSDTDGDGYLDGEEVKAGYDPKDPTSGAKLFDLKAEIEKLEE